MIKSLFTLTLFASSVALSFAPSFAQAKVTTTSVGVIHYGDIVRTVDLEKKEVCYIVSGGENGDMACVTRPVSKAPAFLKVASVDHDTVMTLTDDSLNVTCTVTRFYQGAKISCQ